MQAKPAELLRRPPRADDMFFQDFYHFQAVGLLKGKLKERDDKFFIEVDGLDYSAYFEKTLFFLFRRYKEKHSEVLNNQLYFKVYPRLFILPGKLPLLFFQILSWEEDNSWGIPGFFVFRGIWQQIPQVKGTVISVYRNKEALDATKNFKPTHVPVLFKRNDDIKPFKYVNAKSSPNSPSDKPKKYFIQSVFRFLPDKKCFGFVKDLCPPQETIPTYKIPKAAKLRQEIKQRLKDKESSND